MKKNIYLIPILMLLFMSNCNVSDQLEQDTPDSKLLFATNELARDIYLAPSVQEYQYQLLVHRSGLRNNNRAEAGISVDETILNDYNSQHGTAIQLVPADYYEYNSTVEISGGEEYGTFDITIQVRRIVDELDNNLPYAIPFTISGSDGTEINDEKNNVLLKLNLREPFVRQQTFGTDQGAATGQTSFHRSYTVYVEFENEWDIAVGYEAALDLVGDYNEAHSTSYNPFPVANISNIPSDFTLAAGTNSIDVEIELSPADLDYYEPFLLPIRLVSRGDFPIDTEQDIIYLIFQRDFDQADAQVIPLTADMIETFTQESSEGPKESLVDGDTSTYWHSSWSSGVEPLPHWIQINFDNPVEIGGFNYTFRQPSGINDRPNHFDFQTSEDGVVWNTVWESSPGLPVEPVDERQTLVFDQNYSVRFFRVRILDTYANSNWTHLSTIEVFTVKE